MKFLRTLRLDPSDTFVFARAAVPGEWAVTGSVLFWGADPGDAAPKMRAAFRAGFLGLTSFGFSTLVEVAEIGTEERDALVETFAAALLERFFRDLPTPVLADEPVTDFQTLIAALPPSQREVVDNVESDGNESRGGCAGTASTVGSVKLKAHRAYTKLRSVLR